MEIQDSINEAGFGSIGIGLWLQAGGLVAALVGFGIVGRDYTEHSPPAKPETLGV